jgi:hypothetical protein
MSNRLTDTLIGLGIAFTVTAVITVPAMLLPEQCLRLLTAFGLIALCFTLISRSARRLGADR